MTNPHRAPPSGRPKLLLVEDDAGIRRGLQLLLQGQGFDVHSFASAHAALEYNDVADTHCLVVDYALADSNGIALLADLRNRGWTGKAVLITAFASSELRVAAAAAGFAAMLDKPFRDDDLLRVVRA